MVCASALSFLDGKICAIQELSIIIVIIIIIIIMLVRLRSPRVRLKALTNTDTSCISEKRRERTPLGWKWWATLKPLKKMALTSNTSQAPKRASATNLLVQNINGREIREHHQEVRHCTSRRLHPDHPSHPWIYYVCRSNDFTEHLVTLLLPRTPCPSFSMHSGTLSIVKQHGWQTQPVWYCT